MRVLTKPMMAIGLILAGSCIAAFAEQPVTIVQRQRAFSQTQLTISKNTIVDFENDDDYAHELEISGGTMEFESGIQLQGATVSVPFPDPGKFLVQCGIHPRMKLTIRVE